MERLIGERLVLGFRGCEVPDWLRQFAREFGLGGVILFDYDVARRRYGRNVESPAQLTALCTDLHRLPSRPLIFVDQEGGRVRRLKEERGFAPLPGAREFAALDEGEKRAIVERSFAELRTLGIDYNLAPVVDLELNADSPDIGALARAYSGEPAVVAHNARLLGEVARRVGLGLCVKHYPGLGAASTDSHQALTDLSGRVSEEQLRLFVDLARELPGRAILLSHGIVREWDPENPVSVSPVAVAELRRQVSDALLLTDDLEMQGLQLRYGRVQACLQGLRAGVDLLLVGNNLLPAEEGCIGLARELRRAVAEDPALREGLGAALGRVRERKRRLGGG